MDRRLSGWLLALLLLVGMAGCKHSTEKFDSTTRIFQVKGVVVATAAERGEVTLNHEAIPGLMGAMTMPYELVNPNVTSELHPGDRIRARLLADQTPDGDYRHARLDEIVILGQARPDVKPTSDFHVPTAGDAVPNFQLIGQNGRPVQMAAYRGKALLLTFIYTRCPLNDFCPKMSRNFAEIDKALRAEPLLYGKTALLSVSFDPAFDKPEVLRAYGLHYTDEAGFAHWTFATPVGDNLERMEKFFNLGTTPEAPNTITHSLSTVLIGPDGKVAAWYPGSEWSPLDVVAKIRQQVLPFEAHKY